MPQISVIVPVYKVEAYLPACVESILAQTERDFELLLVDDGSPDNCPALCDDYAARDHRVRVIHKPNGGVSSARNAGLDQALGEYVVFIDSDDYVDADYLSNLLRCHLAAAAPEKTLTVTDYQPFSPKGDETREFPRAFSVELSGSEASEASAQAFRDLIFGFRLFPPYCKLYRRDLIEEERLRFDREIRSAEDFDFNMRYLRHVEAVSYEPIPSYHYRIDYKTYRPSNRGVLGDSEIKSAHIMARGITDLAKRMGVYDAVEPEILRWAARKHYFNRLPMLFAENREVCAAERKQLYRRLLSDPVYRSASKRGIRLLPKGTTRNIGCYADCFPMWRLFYTRVHKAQDKK